MKDKIITFIIGLLIGAILASAGFLIYSKVNSSNSNAGQMGGPGTSMQNGVNGEPPAMPSGSSSQSTSSNTTTAQ